MQSKYKVEYEIGIDEAGRGPLLGRVYAGAVIWNNDNNIKKASLSDQPIKKKSK